MACRHADHAGCGSISPARARRRRCPRRSASSTTTRRSTSARACPSRMGARGVHAPLARRDQLLDANGNNGSFNSLTTDKIVVVLDPYHNHRDEALFEINPAGVRGDQLNGDQAWDPIWTAATNIDSLGWTAEMRIPYSQLRFSRDSVQLWGMQMWRYEDRLNEQDMWSFWRRSDAGGPAYFGSVEGIRIGERRAAARASSVRRSRASSCRYADAGDPFHGSHDTRIRAGGDMKYLLTSNLTLDATFNPDFGQVEVDPATLNLSAVRDVLRREAPVLHRRIERVQLWRGELQFLQQHRPASACSTRAASAACRSSSDWVQGPVDLRGRARLHDDPRRREDHRAHEQRLHRRPARRRDESADGALPPGVRWPTPLKQEVEPLSNYFVGRVRKELNRATRPSASRDVHRAPARRHRCSPISCAVNARRRGWTGGTRGTITTTVGAAASLVSSVKGSAHRHRADAALERALLPASRSRRDTAAVCSTRAYDTTATSLRGYGFYTRLAKESGNWHWELSRPTGGAPASR